jgi:hypothetical protein
MVKISLLELCDLVTNSRNVQVESMRIIYIVLSDCMIMYLCGLEFFII